MGILANIRKQPGILLGITLEYRRVISTAGGAAPKCGWFRPSRTRSGVPEDKWLEVYYVPYISVCADICEILGRLFHGGYESGLRKGVLSCI